MARPSEPSKPQDLQGFRDELRATLAARHELSPEMEGTLATNFLQQIERAIDAKIDSKLDARMAQYTRNRAVGQRNTTAVLGTILGTAIPLVIAGGIFGGANAIVAVCALVLVISLVALFRS